jgi:hypothetical protein
MNRPLFHDQIPLFNHFCWFKSPFLVKNHHSSPSLLLKSPFLDG